MPHAKAASLDPSHDTYNHTIVADYIQYIPMEITKWSPAMPSRDGSGISVSRMLRKRVVGRNAGRWC